MSNLTDELRPKLNNLLNSKLKSDKEISKLLEKIKNSTTYEDAYAYAMRYGEQLGMAVESLGVDTWLFGTAMDTWEPSIKEMVSDVNKACTRIQKNKNSIEHIGFNPQVEQYNKYNTIELVRGLTESPSTSTNIRAFLDELTEEITPNRFASAFATYSNKQVDTNQRKNIDFLINSGVQIRVTRTYDGVGAHTNTKTPTVCMWCKEKEGTYLFKSTYEASNSGVFARHDGCGCTIDYDNRRTGTRTIKKG